MTRYNEDRGDSTEALEEVSLCLVPDIRWSFPNSPLLGSPGSGSSYYVQWVLRTVKGEGGPIATW